MMSEQVSGLFTTPVAGHEEAMALLGRLADVAQPGAVFAEPVQCGEHIAVMASEVSVGLGYGYGQGGPPGAPPPEGGEDGSPSPVTNGGGGGGGNATARPVAVIHVSSDGVTVEPVLDLTKTALAFFTMLGSMFMIAGKMRRRTRKPR
jgi:uncharacterized spore protein YtfJ